MPGNFLKKLLLCGMAFCAAASLAASVLFENGEVRASIVIDEDASVPVQQAAHELALWLKRATRQEWQIGFAPKEGLFPIYVGDSEFARQHGFDREALSADGFLWKATPDYLLIAGRDYPGGKFDGIIQPMIGHYVWSPDLQLCAFGEMGTWNGVERFVEKFLGIRWYMTGTLGTVVPPCYELSVPDMEQTDAPDCEYRYAYFCSFRDALRDALWYRRVGFGGKYPVTITHNYSNMLRFKDIRPDFFALIDGQRDFTNLSVQQPNSGNYCLTNPDLIQTWIDDICDFFEHNPDQEIYPLCPNDGLDRICQCPDCQALLSPELGKWGEFSNYVWTFTDKVARGVAERFPDKKVGTFAYEKYRFPPTTPAELSPNVAVMICYTRFCLDNPEYKSDIRDVIEKWTQRVPNVYFWTYPIADYWPPWKGMPVCYPHMLAEDIRANRALGNIRGEFLESEFTLETTPGYDYWRITSPGLSHLNAYVTAKLLWDADTDVDALLDEYYSNFYGPAAEVMKRFWTKAEQICISHKFFWGVTTPKRFYTKEDIQEFYDLLQQALKLLVPDSDEHMRVNMIFREMKPYGDQLIGSAASMRELGLTKIAGELPLGGDLAGTPWTQAAKYDFTAKDGSAATFKTSVLAAATEEGLAFTFQCAEPEMKNLTMKCRENDDGGIWQDDCIEIFLSLPNRPGFRHYILTAGNLIWDGICEGEDAPEDMKWNSRCRHQVTLQDDAWQLQVIIPWDELELQPFEANVRANIYRNRYAGKDGMYFAFSPNPDSAHRNVDYFVPVRVKE